MSWVLIEIITLNQEGQGKAAALFVGAPPHPSDENHSVKTLRIQLLDFNGSLRHLQKDDSQSF
jgi:hypothetical protein